MPTTPKTDPRQQILRELETLLVEDLQLRLEPGEFDESLELMDGGLSLDSVVIVELITHLEKRFQFQFDDQNLGTDVFQNVGNLADFLAEERAAGAPATAATASA